MSKQLNNITRQLLLDLKADIEELLKKDSNIEVIWKLEKLHNDKTLLKSSELIRRSLNK